MIIKYYISFGFGYHIIDIVHCNGRRCAQNTTLITHKFILRSLEMDAHVVLSSSGIFIRFSILPIYRYI